MAVGCPVPPDGCHGRGAQPPERRRSERAGGKGSGASSADPGLQKQEGKLYPTPSSQDKFNSVNTAQKQGSPVSTTVVGAPGLLSQF